jgi:hypothetical protein
MAIVSFAAEVSVKVLFGMVSELSANPLKLTAPLFDTSGNPAATSPAAGAL